MQLGTWFLSTSSIVAFGSYPQVVGVEFIRPHHGKQTKIALEPDNFRGWRLSALVCTAGGLWFYLFAIGLYFNRL
jgi:hypothetical protein